MPRPGAASSASPTLTCYACHGAFPRSSFPTEINEEGMECCPECGSEFVELVDQAFSRQSVGNAGISWQQSAASRNDQQPGSGDSNPSSGAGAQSEAGGARAPRIEVHAMFHSSSGDGADMPLTFVDAISRFAPLSLPNGQQAFVLQVQDGALLSPFTMGIPFGDALALNPADWVVGDDLDAVVTRVLDAYMPPRRAAAAEVRDALPRLRVRPGPLSSRPTAALEAAAYAASPSLRPAAYAANITVATSGGGDRGGAAAGDASAIAGCTATVSGAAGSHSGPASPAAAAARGGELGKQGQEKQPQLGEAAAMKAPVSQQPAVVAVRLEVQEATASEGRSAPGPEGEQNGGAVRLRLQYDADAADTVLLDSAAHGSDGGSAVRAATPERPSAPSSASAVAEPIPCPGPTPVSASGSEAEAAASASSGANGYASCQPGELCTVCHDAFEPGGEVVELPCHHCFHEDCIMPWLQQQNTCPVCRTRLREGDSSIRSSQRQQQQQQGGSSLDPSALATDTGAHDDRSAQRSRSGGGGAADGEWTRMHLPRRGGGGGRPPAHFPLLEALWPQQPSATGLPAMTPDERRAAMNALSALRTRFSPLQFASASSSSLAAAGIVSGPATAGAPMPVFSGATVMPFFGGMAAPPTRGSRVPSQTRSPAAGGVSAQQQQRQAGQGTWAPLRGGFFNNPLLNLYGGTTDMSTSSRSSGDALGGGVGGGTRSALRGGFFNSGGGAAATASQRQQGSDTTTSGGGAAPAAGLGTAGTLPRRQQLPQQRQQQPVLGNRGGTGRAAGAATTSPSAASLGLRPETLPHMIWSISLAAIAEQTGLLPSSPYGNRGPSSNLTNTAFLMNAATAAAATTVGRSRPASTVPSASEPAALRPTSSSTQPSSSPSSAQSSSVPSELDAARGTDRTGAAAGETRTLSSLALQDPNLGSEAVLRHLQAMLPRLDRAGRPRPSEAELRSLLRKALMTATRMLQSLPLGLPDPALMPQVAFVGHQWLSRAVALVRDTPRAAAAPPRSPPARPSSAAGSSGSGACAAGAGSQRGRASGDGDRGIEGAGSADEGPIRQVARRTQQQDAATLANQKSGNNGDVSTDTPGAELPSLGTSPAVESSRGRQEGTTVQGDCTEPTAVVGAAAEEQPTAQLSRSAAAPQLSSEATGSAVRRGGSGCGASCDAGGGSGRADATGAGNAAAEGDCIRMAARAKVVKRARVVAQAARKATAEAPGPGAPHCMASTSRPRSVEPVDIVGSGSESGGGSGEAAAGALRSAAAAGARRGGSGAGSGGGGRGVGAGFNPVAAVIGGAGAGLRLLGGVAGALLRRGRGANSTGNDGSAGRRDDDSGAGAADGSGH